jgi:Allene oxide cyclase
MRKTPIIVAAALAAGTAGAITLTIGQAGADTATRTHTVRTSTYQPVGHFNFVERAVTDTVVDLAPKGDSRGDLLAFANPVYNATNNKKVGHDEGSCVRTAPGKSWECEWTLRLPKGHLVVQGPFFDTRDSVLAITGGTGIWAQARGQMVLHARNAAGTAFDFRYHVTK